MMFPKNPGRAQALKSIAEPGAELGKRAVAKARGPMMGASFGGRKGRIGALRQISGIDKVGRI